MDECTAMVQEEVREEVKLIVNAPLPSLYPLWERYTEACAKGWRDRFIIREILKKARLP
ncbi:hypothetical protein Syun_029597 [Stephania yunnanensis]|uniref:Uncharacterized protein n=1 Tax=Stephania yunnanensis TaxID=152371 RepID=A0AAP0EDG9_9MAGN